MSSPTSPSSLRIAHIGDLHIGGSYGLGDEDTGGVNSRLLDVGAAWVRSCEQMVADKVDLVLFPGDAFETSKPTPTEEAAFAEGLRILIAAGIRIIGCVGNHESPRLVGREHGLAIFNDFEGSEALFADRSGLVRPEQIGLPIAVAILPHINPAHLAARDPAYAALGIDDRSHYLVEKMLEVLRGLAFEAGQSNPPLGAVLIAHGNIAGSAIGAEQSTLLLRDPVLPLPEIESLGFRYQAWCHLHKAQQLTPTIAYSGAIERCNFSEVTDPDKGFWIVDITEAGVTTEWRSSSPRPLIDVEIKDPTNWQASLPGSEEEGRVIHGAIVRIKYSATPEIHKTVDQDAIRRAFYADGAKKVYGPVVTVIREANNGAGSDLTEEVGALEAWRQFAALQEIKGKDLDRLEALLREALEVAA